MATKQETPKCSECIDIEFVEYNGSPSRYYCTNSEATKEKGACKICNCDRGNSELKIKTSPRWCPRREK